MAPSAAGSALGSEVNSKGKPSPEVNSKGKALDNPGCGVWDPIGRVWIGFPVSVAGRCCLTLGISLKAFAGAKRIPRDRTPCVGSALSLQGLWDSLVVAGTPVAFQPCPKLLQQALGAMQEDTETLHFLWSQTLTLCRENLPLGRSRHKSWMSGTVLGKAGKSVRARGPCSAHCPSLHPSQHSRESCVPACVTAALGAGSSQLSERFAKLYLFLKFLNLLGRK